MGREGIGKIIGSGLLNRVTEKATVVGATVLGGLTALCNDPVWFKITLKYRNIRCTDSSIRQHF